MSFLSRAGTAALDILSYTPYFRGKGRIALVVLRACRSVLPLPVRLSNNSRLWVDLDDAGQLILPYWIGVYEHELFRAFQYCLGQLQPGETFIDVGTNVGYYTVFAGYQWRADRNRTLHAFEPYPRAVALLRKNLELNRLTNVAVNSMGVADQTGELTLYLNPYGVTFGSLRPFLDVHTESIQVPVTTLNDYASKQPALRAGVIKIDVEGAEPLVLYGARALLERDQPYILYEEYEQAYQSFGYTLAAGRQVLYDIGYRLYTWAAHGHLQEIPSHLADDDPLQHGYRNVLAVPVRRSLPNY